MVASGTYGLASQVDVSAAVFVHGAGDQPVPLLISTAPTAIAVTSPNALVRRFELVHFGGGDALLVDAGVVEQAVVRGSSAQFACQVRGARLHDSICWSTGAGGRAVGMLAATSFDFTHLRNVTAIASGAGSRALDVEGTSGSFGEVDGTNVIARGAGVDIEAEADGSPGSGAAIVLAYSNFGTRSTIGPNTAATPPGLGYNQTDPPVFADPGIGDFHEHPDSPTIERGGYEAGVSVEGVDDEARVQGYGIDIGADEYLLEPPPPDVNPPDTKILKGPVQADEASPRAVQVRHHRARQRDPAVQPRRRPLQGLQLAEASQGRRRQPRLPRLRDRRRRQRRPEPRRADVARQAQEEEKEERRRSRGPRRWPQVADAAICGLRSAAIPATKSRQVTRLGSHTLDVAAPKGDASSARPRFYRYWRFT